MQRVLTAQGEVLHDVSAASIASPLKFVRAVVERGRRAVRSLLSVNVSIDYLAILQCHDGRARDACGGRHPNMITRSLLSSPPFACRSTSITISALVMHAHVRFVPPVAVVVVKIDLILLLLVTRSLSRLIISPRPPLRCHVLLLELRLRLLLLLLLPFFDSLGQALKHLHHARIGRDVRLFHYR